MFDCGYVFYPLVNFCKLLSALNGFGIISADFEISTKKRKKLTQIKRGSTDKINDLFSRLNRCLNSRVLKNKLDIRENEGLDIAERLLVRIRVAAGTPLSNFDFTHLRSIHRHLFQDIYEWVGELRQVDIAKTDWFLPFDRIEMGIADVHKRLTKLNFLRVLGRNKFSARAGHILGDINYAHPFREGNGRTQTHNLKQLCKVAKRPIDLTKLSQEQWFEASI